MAAELSSKITDTLIKFQSIDLNSISNADKNILLTLSDNSVPYEWRKIWQGPKMASEFLKSVTVRIQMILKFINRLDEPINEIDFAKIFNVDSFLSTLKLVTSRDLKMSASDLILESFIDDAKFESMKNQKVIKISPLIVDGLGFERNKLVASDGINGNKMTENVYIYFKEALKSVEEEIHMFAVPLYSNYSREKLLCTIKINTSLEKTDIIYSGTSLIVPMN